jgi:hypothetical protein
MENRTKPVNKTNSGHAEEYRMSEAPEQQETDFAMEKSARQSSASLRKEETDPGLSKMPLYSNQGRSNQKKNITSWSVLSMVKFSFFKWMETITSKSFKTILYFFQKLLNKKVFFFFQKYMALTKYSIRSILSSKSCG